MAADEASGGTPVDEGTERSTVAQVPKLVAVAGPAMGRALVMSRVLATAGRHATNDLVLADPRVSTIHLELQRAGEHVHIRTVESHSATWFGPHRVYEMDLAPGGEIVVGDTTLRLEGTETTSTAILSAQSSFAGLVGQTAAMRELFATLARIAPKALGVLVQGEMGTGKREVALALHERSPRAEAPFLVVDASALPDSLAEAVLFGYEQGAFPGADAGCAGALEAAGGGTLFIEEVGELKASLQSKLRGVLERREVVRVGGHLPRKLDVRVIAATRRDLRLEIEEGTFREDLYYRLAQVRLVLPPLRDRLDDVPLLCQKILASLPAHDDMPVLIEQGAVDFLAARPWPGNVRELQNALGRAASLSRDGIVRRKDVAGEGYGFRATREEREAIDVSGPFASAKQRAAVRFDVAYLAMLMRRCDGSLPLAARESGLARHDLRELLRTRGFPAEGWLDERD